MAVIDTILTFGMGWLLGKGGPFGGKTKKSTASAQPPLPAPPASKPSNVPWPSAKDTSIEPGAELPGVPWASSSASPQEQAAAIKDAEKYHADQQAHLDALAHEAYQKAGSDENARAIIRRKYQARKKALDDYKHEIERAKGGIAYNPNA